MSYSLPKMRGPPPVRMMTSHDVINDLICHDLQIAFDSENTFIHTLSDTSSSVTLPDFVRGECWSLQLPVTDNCLRLTQFSRIPPL